jgi:phage terminase large subunit GpA-like protein
MDAFSDPYIEKIVMESGTQLGKTEFLYNCLGYIIHQAPASTLVILPTLDLARYASRNRIQPMIEACDELRLRKPINDDQYSLLEMNFPNMVLTLSGANSPASLASRPCKYILLDEVNKYPKFMRGEEADPISLSTERQKTFWDKKTLIVSSPTVENGQVTRERKSCDITYHCYVPCLECGAMQVLEFEHVKWPDNLDKNSPTYIQEVQESAWYECPYCHAMLENNQRAAMIAGYEWRQDEPISATYTGSVRSNGYHLNSLYSPWLTWGDIAAEFLRSKNYPEKLQNFLNSWLAQPWVERIHEVEEDEILSHRTELPPLVVPKEAFVLTAGIDVQKEGFYYVVRAWARDYTSWLIRYGYIMSWDIIHKIIFQDVYPVEDTDQPLHIWRAAIDTGGSEGAEEGVSSTEEVYAWLRDNSQGVVFGVKGSSRSMATRLSQAVIDKMPGRRNIPIPGGIILWNVDTVKFKELIHYRLQVESGQAQAIHLHAETGHDYARQITAEEKRRNQKGKVEWVQIRKDNHYLDCEVYCAATVDPEWWGGLRVLKGRPTSAAQAPRPKALPKSGWLSSHKQGWLRR